MNEEEQKNVEFMKNLTDVRTKIIIGEQITVGINELFRHMVNKKELSEEIVARCNEIFTALLRGESSWGGIPESAKVNIYSALAAVNAYAVFNYHELKPGDKIDMIERAIKIHKSMIDNLERLKKNMVKEIADKEQNNLFTGGEYGKETTPTPQKS